MFSRNSVRYMNGGMRVANLISFSWTSLRLDLYSFSSSASCFFSFAVRFAVFSLLLEFFDLVALVDDRLAHSDRCCLHRRRV